MMYQKGAEVVKDCKEGGERHEGPDAICTCAAALEAGCSIAATQVGTLATITMSQHKHIHMAASPTCLPE